MGYIVFGTSGMSLVDSTILVGRNKGVDNVMEEELILQCWDDRTFTPQDQN